MQEGASDRPDTTTINIEAGGSLSTASSSGVAAINNNGTLNVLGGTFGIGEGVSSGNFTEAAGAILSISRAEFQAGASNSGAGTIRVGQSLQIDGALNVQNVTLYGVLSGPER